MFGIKESFRNNVSGFIFLLCALSIPLIAGGKKKFWKKGKQQKFGNFWMNTKKSEVPCLDVALTSLLAELCWCSTERRSVLRSLQKEQIYSLFEKTTQILNFFGHQCKGSLLPHSNVSLLSKRGFHIRAQTFGVEWQEIRRFIALFLNIKLIFHQIIKLTSRECHPETLSRAVNGNLSQLLLL